MGNVINKLIKNIQEKINYLQKIEANPIEIESWILFLNETLKNTLDILKFNGPVYFKLIIRCQFYIINFVVLLLNFVLHLIDQKNLENFMIIYHLI